MSGHLLHARHPERGCGGQELMVRPAPDTGDEGHPSFYGMRSQEGAGGQDLAQEGRRRREARQETLYEDDALNVNETSAPHRDSHQLALRWRQHTAAQQRPPTVSPRLSEAIIGTAPRVSPALGQACRQNTTHQQRLPRQSSHSWGPTHHRCSR